MGSAIWGVRFRWATRNVTLWLGNERENNSGPSSLVPERMPRPILRYATHLSATNTVPFPNAQKENTARGRIFPSPLLLFLGDGFEGISRSFFPLSSLEQRGTLVPLSKKCLEPESCNCYYINLDRETALNHYYTFILFVCLRSFMDTCPDSDKCNVLV